MTRISTTLICASILLSSSAAYVFADETVGGALQIYSAYPDEQMNPLIAEFNKKYPDVVVEASEQPGEELLSTIELELRANSPRADIVGLNQASINVIRDRHANALEPYVPGEIDKIRPELHDASGVIVPACINPYLIQYNTNKIKPEEAPKSWLDLLDPKWKGQIALADPAKSQSVHSFVWFIATKLGAEDPDNYGWGYFEKLKVNDVRVEAGHGTIRDLTATGERPIGVQLLANAQTSARRGDPTAVVWPTEGTPGEVSSFAMFEGSDNKAAAKAWLDFIISREGQAKMPDSLSCAPIRIDMDYKLPDGSAINDVKIVPVDSKFVADNKRAQTTSFNSAMGR